MAWITLENVTKKFGSVTAVNHLHLTVNAAEFLTLLGPSGCGKTTVLRMIAGLEIPDGGLIRIQDQVVFSSAEGIFIPPGKRGVGLVFQSYALWPHLSVFENVAFGLRVQKVDRGELEKQVARSLDYMQLGGLGDRRPEQLSGGQQQRVALARMLVTQPSTFLMDEPLSNLDAKLRMEMRTEIKRLHKVSKATTIYVTHDQNEALTLSSRVAVMNRGVLQQVDSPRQIYKRPANLFVADFIGSPTINLIRGRIEPENGRFFFNSEAVRIPAPPLAKLAGQDVVAAIRPEDIQITAEQSPDCFSGEVYSVLPAGAEVVIQVKRAGSVFNIRRMGEVALDMEDSVYLILPFESMLFYDSDTGDLLYPGENT
jgi:multiple sugar transport system ATP-binding protein